ncbi:calmodulin-binding protein 60 D-like isoform X1 [Aristolochia californica]|uniref:calmodulin-binding protein 60 D-like isoform X1 n=1 Tax=Aristolochia californica TaxID=171875 RepID=UPI0035D87CD8
MSQKRQPEERNCSEEKRQKVPALRNVIIEATRHHALQKLLSALEPLLRRVVKEEIEEALAKHLCTKKSRLSGRQIHPLSSRSLQLHFTNKLALPIFTGTKIEGEDSSPIAVALVDALTGKVVSVGPESSMRVEIMVLEGDFEGDDEENWTFENFKDNIVREREGKRPLLMGDAFLNLNEGTGLVGELAFTDNSSWTRSRKFKLGARVPNGSFGGVRVREAKTEPFVVKDHRGELYKKHYPPSLLDEVWRLEKIGKDGAFHKRLSSENISTVKDFLTLLSLDCQRLRNILGTGMSAKMWEVTVEHARTCIISNQTYVYYHNPQQLMGVVFNVIGELTGLLNEQKFVPLKELSESQKGEGHRLVRVAYEHWEDVILLDEGALVSNSSNLPAVSFPSDSSEPESPFNNISSCTKSGGFGFIPAMDSSLDMISSVLSVGGIRSCDEYALPPISNMDFRHDLDPHGLLNGSQTFLGEDHFQYFDMDPIPSLHTTLLADSPADLSTAVSGFIAMSARAAAHTKWMMLRAVLRWRFSIRRIVASKKSRAREMERFG